MSMRVTTDRVPVFPGLVIWYVDNSRPMTEVKKHIVIGSVHASLNRLNSLDILHGKIFSKQKQARNFENYVRWLRVKRHKLQAESGGTIYIPSREV